MQRIISKDELINRLNSLMNEFKIIGPKELANKGIFYEQIKDARNLYFGDNFAIEPAKKFFLWPSEWLFRENFQDGKDILEDIAVCGQKRIFIGARPCEAKGLTLLDKVFNSEFKDKTYINERQRTIIFGLPCAKPDKSCFCDSLEGSPFDSRGMDALLIEMGGNFVAEICTDKAKDILGALGKEIDEPAKTFLAETKKNSKRAIERKITPPQDLTPYFDSPYWDKASSSCLSCGVCTYLCPTCHCFDLVDERRKRLRCYDGCAFKDFTLEASGVNPRPTKKERYRQRIFHKFDYFKKIFGENLCVGCGRCIRHCPVKMDITQVLSCVIARPAEGGAKQS